MYKKTRSLAGIGLIILVTLSYLYPDLTSFNTPNSFTGIFFIVFSGFVLLYLFSVVLFLQEKKYKNPDFFDVAFMSPLILWILFTIVAIMVPYDSDFGRLLNSLF